jgi:hypothetical protein
MSDVSSRRKGGVNGAGGWNGLNFFKRTLKFELETFATGRIQVHIQSGYDFTPSGLKVACDSSNWRQFDLTGVCNT